MHDQSANVYAAYGLRIRSPLPLPGVPLAGEGALLDVEITFDAGVQPDAAEWPEPASSADGQRVRLVWPGLGIAMVTEGRSIALSSATDDLRVLGAALAGPALAVINFQRGRAVLHASAVAIDGRVLAFVGPSGAGKSTLAMACVRRAARLVADDVTCIDWRDDQPLAVPAYPGLRLTPASTQLLENDGVLAAAETASSGSKHLRTFGAAFADAPLPLLAVVTLDDAGAWSLTRLRGQTAAMAILRGSYAAPLARRDAAGSHFGVCARLAERIAVHRLARPRDLGALDATVDRLFALAREG